MTDKENTEEVELDDAEDNPWYQFLLASIELDKGDDGAREAKPYGWHWFWGIYGLHREIPAFPELNIDEIEKQLPNNRCINFKPYEEEEERFDGMMFSCDMQEEATSVLYKLLQESDSLETVREIDFSGVIFEDEIHFSNLIFPVPVSFQDSEFHDIVKFIKTCFCSKSEFSNTKFCSILDFDNAKFFGFVNFSDVIFSSAVYFDNATFTDDAAFHRANFSRHVDFIDAKFYRVASFYRTKFDNSVSFSDVIFAKGAKFTHTTFSQRAIFDKVKITGHTDFKYAEFKEFPPSFHNVDMYSDIIWDEIKWPDLNKKSYSSTIKQNISAYEDLASHMKRIDKNHKQHFFYRKEIECRGLLEKNPFIRFSYWLYENLADFGYGIERAFFWWVLHIFVGMVFITATTKSDNCTLQVSFANAHSFLFFHNGPLSGCYDVFKEMTAFKVIWGFQSILGILFLFLLLLTLRIRFRLK